METLKREIKAVSLGRLKDGSIGFMTTEEEGKWYNVQGESEQLEAMVKDVVAKGNIIEFQYNNGIVGSLKLVEKAPEKKSENWADEMNNFEDLLADAHEKYKDKLEIRTEVMRDAEGNAMIDLEKKFAFFKCEVIVDGKTFMGHGDATKENVTSNLIQPHFIRMAETRSIVRALRFATNNAKVAVEETDDVPKEKQ